MSCSVYSLRRDGARGAEFQAALVTALSARYFNSCEAKAELKNAFATAGHWVAYTRVSPLVEQYLHTKFGDCPPESRVAFH